MPHNVCEEVDQPCFGVHLGSVRWEGEAVLGHFEEGDPERPHVGSDCVGLTSDSLRGHVIGCTDEGIGIAFGPEFSADAEVAELDLAVAAEEDIGGLDV